MSRPLRQSRRAAFRRLELRCPINRRLVWDTGDGGPLLLIGIGSGTVPLRAILRHRLPASQHPLAYACGPAHLVETVA